MEKIELPVYHFQKSWGGKAFIGILGDEKVLLSYGTKVAVWTVKGVEILGWHSDTTQRHTNAFLVYLGFQTMKKKEMITAIGTNITN